MLCLRTGRGGQCTCFPHSPCSKSHAVTLIHSGGGGNSRSPLVAVSVVVPTSTTSLCGTPLVLPFRRDLLSQQDQKYISDGKLYHLHVWRLSCDTIKQQAFQTRSLGSQQPLGGPQPIACTMIRFARWAAGQGFDPLDPTAAQIASFLFDLFDTHGLSPQTIKGYRTCIGSVLNRTGKARVVLHRTISDMIASMELQRPRITPVLPQWDLGVVLEAPSKSPHEPL